MNIMDRIRRRIIRFLGIEHLADNPNGDRYTFLGSKDVIKKQRLETYKVWYKGISDDLLNFYTAMAAYGNAENPIYNRNKAQYFWGLSPKECGIKRVHSGVPRAIVETMTNAVGVPDVSDEARQEDIDFILRKTKLKDIIAQKQMPMTLAMGYGAFKPIIDKDVCPDCPLLEYYDAEDVDFVVKHDVTIGVIFRDYYRYKEKDYVLVETRRVDKGDSKIEWQLFRLDKSDEVKEVPFETIPELAYLNEYKTGLIINGFPYPLAVPSVFFDDPDNEGYGLSFYEGKIDLFDDLDQSLSQRSQTSRVSTPVEYYPDDLLTRNGKNGNAGLPNIYNRQYIKGGFLYPDGDGNMGGNGMITTTQPQLNFDQYNNEQKAILDMILIGKISPATMGIDLAKKDNATAQREKEKITIMTRDNIVSRQEKIVRRVVWMLSVLLEYMKTGTISLGTDEDSISVKFDDFANPSFESMAQSLLPLWQSGAMSDEMFVDRLYGDSLSEEDKAIEIARMKEKARQDNISLNDFGLGDEADAGNEAKADLNGEPKEEGEI